MKRLKEQQKEAKEQIRKQYQGIVKKHDEKARQRRIDDRVKVRNKADKKQFVRAITKNFEWLSDRLVKPTDEKHLPAGFEKAVADLLQCFDLQTERSKALEVKFGKSKKTLNFENLMRQYQKIAQEDGSGELEYDGYVFEMMDALAEKLQGKTIDQASNADLKQMDTLLKAIVGNFRNVNKVFNENIKESVSQFSETLIQDFKKHGETFKKTRMRDGRFDKIFHGDMVTPVDAFELMGDAMFGLYQKGIRKGLDKHILNIDEARTHLEIITGKWWKKGRSGSEIEEWGKASSLKEFSLEQGSSIKMNPAQIMSLYCLMKREQAQGHILGSGIVPSEVSLGRKVSQVLSGEKNSTSRSNFVTLNDIEKIINTLTDSQIQVANELMKFINTNCSKWGNETSLKLYNYKKFYEENYFPIDSSEGHLNTDLGNNKGNKINAYAIKNPGFTKSTVQNANNPVMIGNIFEVVADHINKMSLYNAFAEPITDFQRIYNYKQHNEMGLTSVKVELKEAFGEKATEYIDTLFNDLNGMGGYQDTALMSFINKGLTAYKKSAIGMNTRVAIQQPTAVIRAFAVINPVYFANGYVNPKKNIEEMKRYCPIALWKSWGFSQTDVSRDMEKIIMNRHWSRFDTLSMGTYSALDTLTWSQIWAAVKRETSVKRKDVEVGSEEFYKICGERASLIFDKTQVVDSPLHKSQIMRKRDVASKTLTSFMAEPTKTYNLTRTEAILGMRDIRVGNVTKGTARIIRANTTYITNALVVAAAAAVMDMVREKIPFGYDDDDAEKWEKFEFWFVNFFENAKDNLNPVNLIPALKDVWSFREGWGSSNMALEGAETIVTAVTDWNKFINGESKKTPEELIEKSLAGIGMVTGVPVKNIIREFKSWTKLAGIEVHAATEGDEKPESERICLTSFGLGLAGVKRKGKIKMTARRRMMRSLLISRRRRMGYLEMKSRM